jgi:phage I-like protein
MSAGKKKEMSAFIADMLGLSADSDEAAIKSAFTALVEKATAPAPAKKPDPIPVMELSKDPVILALTKKLDETTAELARIQSGAVNQMALAKKTEIDTLLARASSEGRVVPFETADLYEVKDGVCTIHMEPSKLSKMIEKLPKDTITLSRKRGEAPKVNGSDNKPLNMDRSTPEGLKNTIAFCRRTREANEREFGAQIKRLALSDNGN